MTNEQHLAVIETQKKLDLYLKQEDISLNAQMDLGESATKLKKLIGKKGWEKFLKVNFPKRENRIREAIAEFKLRKKYPNYKWENIIISNRIQLAQALTGANKAKIDAVKTIIKNSNLRINGKDVPLKNISYRVLKSELKKLSKPHDSTQAMHTIGKNDTKKSLQKINSFKKRINQTIGWFDNCSTIPGPKHKEQIQLLLINITNLKKKIKALLNEN